MFGRILAEAQPAIYATARKQLIVLLDDYASAMRMQVDLIFRGKSGVGELLLIAVNGQSCPARLQFFPWQTAHPLHPEPVPESISYGPQPLYTIRYCPKAMPH